MKIALLSREYPPEVYGGAGVHVDYLSRELSKLMQVEVRCYGKEPREFRLDTPELKATGFGLDSSGYTAPKPLHSVFGAVQRCLDWNTTNIDASAMAIPKGHAPLVGIFAVTVPVAVFITETVPEPWLVT